MSRQSQNSGFICDHCCQQVIPVTNGSYRNHCPFCLYSKHLDYVPGDRGSACGGLMEPMGLTYKSGKGFQIVHRCLKCGIKRLNKVAENTIQPDDIEALVDPFPSVKLCSHSSVTDGAQNGQFGSHPICIEKVWHEYE